MENQSNRNSLNGTMNPKFAYDLPYETLVEYLDDKLSESEKKQVEEYLDTHPEERDVLRGIELLRKKEGTTNLDEFLKPSNEELKDLQQQFEVDQGDSAALAPSLGLEQKSSRPMAGDRLKFFISSEPDLEDSAFSSFTQSDLEFIGQFNTQLRKKEELYEVYRFVCDTVRDQLNCRSASIFLYNAAGKLERNYISGFDQGLEPAKEIFEVGQGFVGKAVGSREDYGKLYKHNELDSLVKKEGDPALNSYINNLRSAVLNQYGHDEPINHIIAAPLNAFRRSAGIIRVLNKVDTTTGKLHRVGFNKHDAARLQLIAALSTNTISYLKMKMRNQVLYDIPLLFNRSRQNELFDRIASSLINDATLYDTCIVRIVDPKNRYLQAWGTSGKDLDPVIHRIKVEEGVTGTTFYADSYRIIEDLTQDSKNFIHTDWAKKNRLVSMICFPLRSGDGSINYGTLSVYTKFKFEFGTDNIEYLQRFANLVSGVIESIQDTAEQKLLKRISEHLIQGYNIEEVMLETTRFLPWVIGFDRCRIILKDKRFFRIVSKREDGPRIFNIPFDNAISKHIIANPKQILKFKDVEQADLLKGVAPYLKNIRSLVLIPISNSDGELYGVIALVTLIDKQVHVEKDRQAKVSENLMSKLNQDLLSTISNLFSSAIENMKVREKRDKINQELIEERHLLRTLIDKLPILIYVKDVNHRFILINQAQANILGISSPDDAIGKTDFHFFKQHAAQSYQAKEDLLFNREKQMIEAIEAVYDSKEENTKTFSTKKVIYTDSQGKIKGLVGTGTDISSLKDDERLLKETVSQLEKANKQANKQVQDIRIQYQDYKARVGILTERIIAETNPDSDLHLYARIIAADFFVGKELFVKYLSKQSLKPNDFAERRFSSVFEEGFEELIKLIPNALGENASVVFSIDERDDKVCSFDKKHIQDIILTLVKNAIEHKIKGKNSTIYIETMNQYLIVKNDSPQTPRDLKKLKQIVTASEYHEEGPTLFAIHKYFKENYQKDIDIDYKNDQFIVGLPLLASN